MQYIVKSKIGFGGNLGWSTCPAEQSKSWNCSNICQEMQFSSQFGHFLEITLDRVLEQAMLLDESSIKLFGSSLHLCQSLNLFPQSPPVGLEHPQVTNFEFRPSFGAGPANQIWFTTQHCLLHCLCHRLCPCIQIWPISNSVPRLVLACLLDCQPNLIHANSWLSVFLPVFVYVFVFVFVSPVAPDHTQVTNFKFFSSFGAGLPSGLPTKPDSQFSVSEFRLCLSLSVYFGQNHLIFPLRHQTISGTRVPVVNHGEPTHFCEQRIPANTNNFTVFAHKKLQIYMVHNRNQLSYLVNVWEDIDKI